MSNPKISKPYSSIGVFPTPIKYSDTLSTMINRPIYLKHEDEADSISSGNKVRKLRYLFNYLRENKIDHVIADGTTQSNSLMSLATYAKEFGITTHLILYGDQAMKANHKIIADYATDIQYLREWNADDIRRLRENTTAKLVKQGNRVFNAPTGLSSNETVYAGCDIADEVHSQEQELQVSFTRIYVAAGTGSTVAGLSFRDQQLSEANRVIGVVVANSASYFKHATSKYFEHLNGVSSSNDLKLPYFTESALGAGYAQASDRDRELQNELLESGLFFDSVYMLKVIKAALTDTEVPGNDPVLIIHTGGNNQQQLLEDA